MRLKFAKRNGDKTKGLWTVGFHRVFFNWVSKVIRSCFGFALLRSVIGGFKNLAQPPSLIKCKTLVTRVFPRLVSAGYVLPSQFASSSHWFILLFIFVVNGHCNCLGLKTALWLVGYGYVTTGKLDKFPLASLVKPALYLKSDSLKQNRKLISSNELNFLATQQHDNTWPILTLFHSGLFDVCLLVCLFVCCLLALFPFLVLLCLIVNLSLLLFS